VVELRINICSQIHTMRPGHCKDLPGHCKHSEFQRSPRRPVPVDLDDGTNPYGVAVLPAWTVLGWILNTVATGRTVTDTGSTSYEVPVYGRSLRGSSSG